MDNNGTIDYGEFIAVMLHLNKVETDSTGYITADELKCEEFGLGDVKLAANLKNTRMFWRLPSLEFMTVGCLLSTEARGPEPPTHTAHSAYH